MITLFDGINSIDFLVLRKFDHFDMMSEVDIYQSNKVFGVLKILNIQNHVIQSKGTFFW